MSGLVDKLQAPIIPDIAFTRLADIHGTWPSHIAFDWETSKFAVWVPPGPPDPRRRWETDHTQIIGHVDPDADDVMYVDPAPSINDEVFVVNLLSPDLDPTLFLPDKSWRKQAKCSEFNKVFGRDQRVRRVYRYDPTLFYAEAGDTTTATKAKAVCRECDVLAECLRWAIVSNETRGVWGGLGEEERRVARRRFVQDPEAFEPLCEEIAVALRGGKKPDILRYRNTPGVTHGKISTWNRGCQDGPNGRACRACRVAMTLAAVKQRDRKISDTRNASDTYPGDLGHKNEPTKETQPT